MTTTAHLADPTTPSALAYLAVCDNDYDRLRELTSRHQASCTQLVGFTLGHALSPLTEAARSGDTLAVNLLLEAGADVDQRAHGNLPQTPTHWAIEAGSLGCVRMLLAHRPTPADDEDWAATAIRHSRREQTEKIPECTTILRAVLKAGAPATPAALQAAVKDGRYVAALDLIRHGADPMATHQGYPIACDVFALVGYTDDSETLGPRMLRVLLDNGLDPDVPCGPQGMYRPPALAYAIERGAAWALRPLIDEGADVHAVKRLIAKNGLRTRHAPHCGHPAAIVDALHLWAELTG